MHGELKSPESKKRKMETSSKNGDSTNGSAAKNGTSSAASGGNIDESLYSRQLYVLGHNAMKKMATSKVR